MAFGWRGRDRASETRSNEKRGEEYEYYEDTHDERGEYIGLQNNGFVQTDMNISSAPAAKMKKNDTAVEANNGNQRIIVYYPKTPEDVMVLIKHLKMNNPAVVNLEDIDEETAQRILDFLSGAICALSGTAHRISGNLFLFSPKGVEITIPYEQK